MGDKEKKLEHCEVCGKSKAVYTCPKCEVRTCCLQCVNIHKKELDCDGLRDKTKFIPLNKFTDLDLLSDYRLLEQIGRSIQSLQTDPSRRFTRQRELPHHLYKLKSAAYQRGTFLHLMPQNFSKHKENTTYLDFKTNEILWRIEWIFPQADNLRFISERISENETLANVLSKIWNPVDNDDNEKDDFENLNTKLSIRDKLQFYSAANFPGIKILLKAEKVKNCKTKYYELDAEDTFQENLKKRNIIEFPTLYVILKNHSDIYEIIDTDDELSFKDKYDEKNNDGINRTVTRRNKFVKRRRPMNNFRTKQRKVETEQKGEVKTNSTSNYFFNGDISDSDNDACTINKS